MIIIFYSRIPAAREAGEYVQENPGIKKRQSQRLSLKGGIFIYVRRFSSELMSLKEPTVQSMIVKKIG